VRRKSERTPSVPETIANTSPLQYLHQAGVLGLLPALYGRVVVPESVAEELARGQERGVALPDVSKLHWAEVRRAQEQGLLPLVSDLGPGEREALALGVEFPGSLVILDDALARRHAQLLGLRHTGTLGVLLRAKREGRLEAVGPILDEFERLRFRLDPGTRAAVLAEAGE
jgi:predicted nucleic acid-binding protein